MGLGVECWNSKIEGKNLKVKLCYKQTLAGHTLDSVYFDVHMTFLKRKFGSIVGTFNVHRYKLLK